MIDQYKIYTLKTFLLLKIITYYIKMTHGSYYIVFNGITIKRSELI